MQVHSRAAVSGILLATALVLASCGTKSNNQLGVALIQDEGKRKAVRLIEVSAPDITSNYQLPEVPVGAGLIGTLLAGSRPGFLARGLVRFDPDAIPATGTVVDSAAVEWPLREGLGATPPLTLRLHKVTSDWTETTSDEGSFPTMADAFDSVSVAFPVEVTDQLRFDIRAVAQEWIDEPGSNFGLAIVPVDGADTEVELTTRESGDPARLLLYTTVDGEVVITTVTPSADTHFLETTPAHVTPVGTPPKRLTLARGLPARALMKFSWPELTDRVTINRAELTVFVDGASTLSNGFNAGVQQVLGEWTADSTEVDPLLFGVSFISADTDSAVFAMTGIIGALLVEENFGFQVRALDERVDTDVLRIHGADTDVPGKAPRLRIWYTPGTDEEVSS